jgi:hypothetical protein
MPHAFHFAYFLFSCLPTFSDIHMNAQAFGFGTAVVTAAGQR